MLLTGKTPCWLITRSRTSTTYPLWRSSANVTSSIRFTESGLIRLNSVLLRDGFVLASLTCFCDLLAKFHENLTLSITP
jgi:hypothetical protein